MYFRLFRQKHCPIPATSWLAISRAEFRVQSVYILCLAQTRSTDTRPGRLGHAPADLAERLNA